MCSCDKQPPSYSFSIIGIVFLMLATDTHLDALKSINSRSMQRKHGGGGGQNSEA
jgi:hypothetical protein